MDTVIVTDFEEVEKDDFYLSKSWKKEVGKETVKEARKLQKQGNLFVAYEVGAVAYCVYSQMDAHKIFIDKERNIVMRCETDVIGHDFREVWEGETL